MPLRGEVAMDLREPFNSDGERHQHGEEYSTSEAEPADLASELGNVSKECKLVGNSLQHAGEAAAVERYRPRLHFTLLDKHFRVEGRRTWFETIEEMQACLDLFLQSYNRERPHQGRGMRGRTQQRAFLDGIPANDNQPTEEKVGKATSKKIA